ncbi:MAG: hypothetical protein VX899_08650 [Myxococcota bacterium]|nr:hypothetical protein [Myxococcota bacterium]
MLILLATMGCMRRDLPGTYWGEFDCESALEEGEETCTGEMFVSVPLVSERRRSFTTLELDGSCGETPVSMREYPTLEWNRVAHRSDITAIYYSLDMSCIPVSGPPPERCILSQESWTKVGDELTVDYEPLGCPVRLLKD